MNTTPPNAGTPVAQLERELAFVTDVIAQGARALALLVDVQVLCHDELADAKRSAAAGGGRGAR